ncbi:flagellar hook-basal body complex protein FliE [Oribacterium asaccharolyticum ACB7]|uniref:Flagellar hook-basal body complex protein FliE n=1 Tax=Oribacterium asaccharolyticum ACB7 TaxID=796944 RepID=G9WRC6_9FIRM|nr:MULTISPECIES: flagellar hook-basal body complex protein FliE [Oribacterium]EGL38184.1 flagellar hook-basal body complex protein FliE [Oribacterium sp. oral taxon 108 str. F0425]EHL14313.1 flagellar hook-basal body complex protein FliE [Oribacterium asaccharolyticum ACB7]
MENIAFIQPMTSWKLGNIGDTTAVERGLTGTENGSLFRDVFKSAIDNVKTTQLDVENKQYLLATGQLSDAHSLPIAEAKAQISLDLLVTLRNKALESYNDLMKISL